jgi:hypothetical protein
MAHAHEPSSFEILREEGSRREGNGQTREPVPSDFEQHVRTYRTFLRTVAIFVAHVAVLLALMYIFLVR